MINPTENNLRALRHMLVYGSENRDASLPMFCWPLHARFWAMILCSDRNMLHCRMGTVEDYGKANCYTCPAALLYSPKGGDFEWASLSSLKG